MQLLIQRSAVLKAFIVGETNEDYGDELCLQSVLISTSSDRLVGARSAGDIYYASSASCVVDMSDVKGSVY
jgi:hypothetical protein